MTLSAAGLRLQFARSGDRFVHQVLWLDTAGNEHLLLTTAEGDDTNPWPPSPPLQDLHLESRGGGATVALAVGMAGRSHWSLSVEALPAGELRFDVACRTIDPPGPLGSSYHLVISSFCSLAMQFLYLAGSEHCCRVTARSISCGSSENSKVTVTSQICYNPTTQLKTASK